MFQFMSPQAASEARGIIALQAILITAYVAQRAYEHRRQLPTAAKRLLRAIVRGATGRSILPRTVTSTRHLTDGTH